jgi:hypothetical protein
MYGTYVYNKCNNSYDTLILSNDGIYHQSLYSLDKYLIYENTGKWYIRSNRIVLKNVLINDDNSICLNFSGWNNSLITSELPTRKRNGKVFIITNLDNGRFYVKIDNK